MTSVKSNKPVTHDEDGVNCYGERVILGKQNFPDLSEFHKTLPEQEISAGEFCRKMGSCGRTPKSVRSELSHFPEVPF